MSNQSERPSALPWSHRAAAMPWLPGGNDGQLTGLRAVLTAVLSGATDDDLVALDGTDGISMGVAGKRLQPTGLMKRAEHGRWKLSPYAEAWLSSNDSKYLVGVLHSHIRYIGELMDELRDGPATHQQLNDRAKLKYELQWSTLDQIRRRTAWLRTSGMVELRFDNTLVLTTDGQTLVSRLELMQPFASEAIADDEVPAPSSADWVVEALEQAANRLAARKPVLGYIPGSADEAIATLRRLTTAASPQITRSAFDRFCETEFGIRPSSSAAALTTLRGAGLVEQVSTDAFAPTPQAMEWLSSESDFDFMRWLHTRFLFFLEIVPLLERASRPKELAAVARTSFQLPREDVDDIRRRLQLLRCAGLIVETAIGCYRATPVGLAVARSVPLQPFGAVNQAGTCGSYLAAAPSEEVDIESLLTQLRLASRDSSHPDLLEKLVAQAIRVLGFQTQWLGGSGRTDVLAIAPYDSGITIVVDAKSTGSGSVGEGQINFDTLKEHQSQHHADCIVIVGPEFSGERLVRRAQQHGVLLLNVDQLETILRRHLSAPLPVSDYAAFFRQGGIAALDSLDKQWAAQHRTSRLVTAVLHRLNAEAASADPITKGALSSSELYLVLRSEMESPPTPDELKEVLDFLSAKPMRCITANKDRYALVEDPATTAKRMRSYSQAAAAAADQVD